MAASMDGKIGGPCHAIKSDRTWCSKPSVMIADGYGYCARHDPSAPRFVKRGMRYEVFVDGVGAGEVWASWNRLIGDHWCNSREHVGAGESGTRTFGYCSRKDAVSALIGNHVERKEW